MKEKLIELWGWFKCYLFVVTFGCAVTLVFYTPWLIMAYLKLKK